MLRFGVIIDSLVIFPRKMIVQKSEYAPAVGQVAFLTRVFVIWILTCCSSTWSLSRRFSASKSSEEEQGSVISSNPKICFVLLRVLKRLNVMLW